MAKLLRLSLPKPHRPKASLYKSCMALMLLAVAGCGANSNMMDQMMNSNRVLQSMTVAPATADGQNFMNGQVAFTAMGTFSKPPSPAMVNFMAPFSGGWSVSNQNIATIDQNGMAQCVHEAVGTVMVTAQASSNAAGPGAMSTAVTATATLTCP